MLNLVIGVFIDLYAQLFPNMFTSTLLL